MRTAVYGTWYSLKLKKFFQARFIHLVIKGPHTFQTPMTKCTFLTVIHMQQDTTSSRNHIFFVSFEKFLKPMVTIHPVIYLQPA